MEDRNTTEESLAGASCFEGTREPDRCTAAAVPTTATVAAFSPTVVPTIATVDVSTATVAPTITAVAGSTATAAPSAATVGRTTAMVAPTAATVVPRVLTRTELGLLLTTHRPAMERAAEKVLGRGRADVHDAIQQTCERFVRSPDRLAAVPALEVGKFLHHAAFFSALDLRASNGRRSSRETLGWDDASTDEVDVPAPSEPSPLDVVCLREVAELISPADVDLLFTVDVLCVDCEELSAKLGIPRSTLWDRLTKVRAKAAAIAARLSRGNNNRRT